MKIGLDTAPAALRGTYFQHLASVLARYAPEHEYIIGTRRRCTDNGSDDLKPW